MPTKKKSKPTSPVDLILQRTTLTALAATLGVTTTAVWNWRFKPIPVGRLLAVYDATGIPPRRLRPDLAELMAIR